MFIRSVIPCTTIKYVTTAPLKKHTTTKMMVVATMKGWDGGSIECVEMSQVDKREEKNCFCMVRIFTKNEVFCKY